MKIYSAYRISVYETSNKFGDYNSIYIGLENLLNIILINENTKVLYSKAMI